MVAVEVAVAPSARSAPVATAPRPTSAAVTAPSTEATTAISNGTRAHRDGTGLSLAAAEAVCGAPDPAAAAAAPTAGDNEDGDDVGDGEPSPDRTPGMAKRGRRSPAVAIPHASASPCHPYAQPRTVSPPPMAVRSWGRRCATPRPHARTAPHAGCRAGRHAHLYHYYHLHSRRRMQATTYPRGRARHLRCGLAAFHPPPPPPTAHRPAMLLLMSLRPPLPPPRSDARPRMRASVTDAGSPRAAGRMPPPPLSVAVLWFQGLMGGRAGGHDKTGGDVLGWNYAQKRRFWHSGPSFRAVPPQQ